MRRQQQQEEEQEQEQEQQEEKQAQTCDKTMCGKMVTSCGMTRTSHCALHLLARTEHMNNTNAHTTIHSPYGIAGVWSSTIWQKLLWLQMNMPKTEGTDKFPLYIFELPYTHTQRNNTRLFKGGAVAQL